MNKKILLTVLSKKGGVGKSFISLNIFDVLRNDFNLPIDCYDTDTASPTMSRFKKANAYHIELLDKLENGEFIAETEDAGKLNCIGDKFEIINEDFITIVDNGSSSFLSFLSWLDGNGVNNYNENIDSFHLICIIPLTSSLNTLESAISVLETYQSGASYILVENEYFGEVNFDESEVFDLFCSAKVNFQILKLTKPTKSIENLIKRVNSLYLLPSEATVDSRFSLIEKSRIQSYFMNFQKGFLTCFERILDGRN